MIEKIGAGEGHRTLVISLEGRCRSVSQPFFPHHTKRGIASTSVAVYWGEMP